MQFSSPAASYLESFFLTVDPECFAEHRPNIIMQYLRDALSFNNMKTEHQFFLTANPECLVKHRPNIMQYSGDALSLSNMKLKNMDLVTAWGNQVCVQILFRDVWSTLLHFRCYYYNCCSKVAKAL